MKEWEDFLKGYGFVPWSAGGMQGWYRQTAFVKDCLAGEIARYYADDYIVIRHEKFFGLVYAAGWKYCSIRRGMRKSVLMI